MKDTSEFSPLIFLALVVISFLASFYVGKLLLRLGAQKKLYGPVLCSFTWGGIALFPSLVFAIFFGHSLEPEFLYLVPIAFILGLAYGTLFYLFQRISNTKGGWYSRAFVGSIFGALLSFIAGISLQNFCTHGCWGGPGGGGNHYDSVIDAAIIFWWIIPIFVVAGIVTPFTVLMPNPAFKRDAEKRGAP